MLTSVLRAPPAGQIFVDVERALRQVRDTLPRQKMPTLKRSVPEEREARFECTDSKRLRKIAAYKETSKAYMPTRWCTTMKLKIPRFYKVDAAQSKIWKLVQKLCRLKNIAAPNDFIRHNAFHYAKFTDGKMTAILSLTVANLNKTPGSLGVSIDLAVSTDTDHAMSAAVDALKASLRKRRNKCVVFTQAARTASAQSFWAGRFTKTKRASIMPVLFHTFDVRYPIYEDTDDMAFFFE